MPRLNSGLQKEGFFAKKPVLVLFYGTPWPQIQDSGWLQLCWQNDGIDAAKAVALMSSFRPTTYPGPIFGDGHAAAHIVSVLEQQGWLRQERRARAA